MSYSIRKNILYSKLSISIQRNNARSILNKQQQLKDFNIPYRNDNYTYNNIINTSPLSVQKSKGSLINLTSNIRRNLVQKNIISSHAPKNMAQVDGFIENIMS